MKLRSSISLILVLLSLINCTDSSEAQVRIEKRKIKNGNVYTFFYPQNCSIVLATQRPDPQNKKYVFSVAAAYTDLQTTQPLDLLVHNGKVLQTNARVGFLDGVLTFINNTISISHIAKGQSPTAAQIEDVRERKGTLLLQELLVYDGKNLKGGGGSIFQRRALVELKDHRFAVIESISDDVTMKQFGDDLIEMGAWKAIYLDMGDWDEGWYKSNGKVVKIGNRRSQTTRQSNWLVFAKPTSQ
ncbi:hypothetical protein QNI19_16765 [Cytophagaceae bacterium DM2B3-1]|uniref:Phosphodiester glycosidase domain-containing protein n=1 Tax=Xanthocytophaga flava TaxID=3048013 RepID=A0ABT7CNL4_9BACT|nr:phosphodiester glycosidase family protein [Xanthocytophaga flavus]MDJ1494600.1 hypothetical protein [Xanthocytophaga flavus]